MVNEARTISYNICENQAAKSPIYTPNEQQTTSTDVYLGPSVVGTDPDPDNVNTDPDPDSVYTDPNPDGVYMDPNPDRVHRPQTQTVSTFIPTQTVLMWIQI
jgi:hypothetical protein